MQQSCADSADSSMLWHCRAPSSAPAVTIPALRGRQPAANPIAARPVQPSLTAVLDADLDNPAPSALQAPRASSFVALLQGESPHATLLQCQLPHQPCLLMMTTMTYTVSLKMLVTCRRDIQKHEAKCHTGTTHRHPASTSRSSSVKLDSW